MNNPNTRTRKHSIGQAFGATAGLITMTAVKTSEAVEKSFDTGIKSLTVVEGAVDIAVSATTLAKAGFDLTGEQWLENLKTENLVDKAYAEVDLIKAQIEVDALKAEAKSLKTSREAK